MVCVTLCNAVPVCVACGRPELVGVALYLLCTHICWVVMCVVYCSGFDVVGWVIIGELGYCVFDCVVLRCVALVWVGLG